MIEAFNAHMLDSQNKWFSITRELTSGSRMLLDMIIKSNHTSLVKDRKFIRLKKRIQRYERFVKKQLDDLLSQSQDISIFDKPSVNELSSYSVSVTPTITQRNMTTFVSLDQFIPINYATLLRDFKKMPGDMKVKILQGFSWRILKSKDKTIRRQTIIGLLVNDLLGVMNGDIMDLLLDKQLMIHVLELFALITEDSYGYRVLFRNGGLYKQLVNLIPEILK